MKQKAVKILLVFVGLIGFTAHSAMSQDVELPLHWKGDGNAKIMTREGLKTVSFNANIHVGEEGEVSGEFSNDEGRVELKKLYYSYPSEGIRKLYLVLANENSDEPMLIVMEGRMIKDEFFYGEVFIKAYESNGEVEENLNLDSEFAQEIYTGYIPSSLETAVKECRPMGAFVIEGDYQ